MRLVRAGDFARVFKLGSRARGDLVTVAAAPNGSAAGDGATRLGLSIGKRVWKGAVKRNRLRRLFREAFRLEYDALPRGFDIVVIGSTPALELGLGEARRELRKLALKAARRAAERSDAEPRRPAEGARPSARPGDVP
jgi:ribonuclease P protein component